MVAETTLVIVILARHHGTITEEMTAATIGHGTITEDLLHRTITDDQMTVIVGVDVLRLHLLATVMMTDLQLGEPAMTPICMLPPELLMLDTLLLTILLQQLTICHQFILGDITHHLTTLQLISLLPQSTELQTQVSLLHDTNL